MNKVLLQMSMKAIKANRLRSLLTTLGIVIGTGLVVIVLSVGAGIEALILDQISSIKPETLYVEIQVPSVGTQGEKNQRTAQDVSSGVEITTLTLDDLEDAKDHYNIEYGSGLTITQGKFSYRDETKISTIWAVQEDYAIMEEMKIADGRFFTQEEEDSLSQVIVLGSKLYEDLFGTEDAVGKFVKLEGKNYEVVGVNEEVGAKFFFDMDDIAYVPVKTAQKKILGEDHILAMQLLMKDPTFIMQTIGDLQRMIRQNHNIQNPDKDDFVVRTMDEAMGIVGSITTGISVLLLAIAGISLVVGGVGIMNIMYVSVSERILEIGLKKAVGAKPSEIQRQFLYEAILITVIGGLIGSIFGIVISWTVSKIAIALGYNWIFIVEIYGVLMAFIVSVTLGLIFGYSPAKKAANVDPIQSLRSNM